MAKGANGAVRFRYDGVQRQDVTSAEGCGVELLPLELLFMAATFLIT